MDRRRWPTRQRLHARSEFGERERLRQVVVGAEPETVDAIADPGSCREDEDPGADRGVDHPAAHLVAGAARHVAVEYRDVVVVHAEAFERGLAVVTDVDGHGELAQPVGDGVGEKPLVVGEKHAHSGRSPSVEGSHGSLPQPV